MTGRLRHACPACDAIDYLPGPQALARCVVCGTVYRRQVEGPLPAVAPTTYDAWQMAPPRRRRAVPQGRRAG